MRICPNCSYRGHELVCPDDEFPMVPEEEFSLAEEQGMIGRTFADRYRVEELVGTGAIGWVFRGVQIATGQTVALKVMRDTAKSNLNLVKRFIEEARISSQLRQPHTVRVFDFGAADDGYLFIVMEFLVGRLLADVLEEAGALPPARAAHIGRQLCHALSEAHELGLVHRDLKPENVFLIDTHGDPDFVKVLDFGIAKAVRPDTSRTPLTQMGATLGTPHYMSPEQAEARDLDGRSDLYSLGILLYEMLTGDVPFHGDNHTAILLQHVGARVAPVPKQVGGRSIPSGLRKLTMQLLEKERDARPGSAVEVAELLAPFAADYEPSQALPAATAAPETTQKAGSWDRPVASLGRGQRRKGLWAALVAVLLLAAGAAVYFGVIDTGGATPKGEPIAKDGPASANDPENAPLNDPANDPGAAGAVASDRAEADAGSAAAQADTSAAQAGEADAATQAGAPDAETPNAEADAAKAPEASAETTAAVEQKDAGKTIKKPRPKPVTMTKAVVNAAFKKRFGQLSACSKHLQGLGDQAPSSVTFHLVVLKSGRVESARLTPSGLGNTKFGACMLKAAKAIRFPAHKDEKAKVRKTLKFVSQ